MGTALRLILLTLFILCEPFLPVKAFFWSNISYQFLIFILALGLFNWPDIKDAKRVVLAGLLFTVFFRPSICGLTFPWSNSLYLALISGLFFLSFFGERELMWRKTPLDIPIISFLILATAYLSLSIDRLQGARQVISLWGAGIFYFLLVREIKDVTSARNIALVFLMGSMRIMVNGLHQFWIGFVDTKVWIETYIQGELAGRLLNRLSCGRVFSNFVYPNAYAGFLIMLIPVIFSLFWQFRGSKKIWVAFLLSLAFFSLYLTYSKGGWLSFALTSLMAFIFLFPKFRILPKLFILFLTIALISGLVAALESTGSTKLGFTDSFKARWEYWQASAHMLRDNPFLGYGAGNFGEIYARYKLPMAEETQMAHNNYLQVWVEMGIAGFLILVWFVFNFLRLGISPSSRLPGAESLLQGAFWGGVAFFIHSLVDFDFYVPNLLFSAFFMIAVAGALNGGGEYILLKNSRARLLCLFLIAVIFLGVFYNQIVYINNIFVVERINDLISVNDIDRAEKELEVFLERNEFNPRLLFEKGHISEIKAFREKKKDFFVKAIYEYRLASGLNPHRAGYHYSLGRLYWSLRGEPSFLKKAISEFRFAHEAYPTKEEYKKVLEDLRQYER